MTYRAASNHPKEEWIPYLHAIVCLDSRVNILLVDTNSHAHDHMLGALHNLIDFRKRGFNSN